VQQIVKCDSPVQRDCRNRLQHYNALFFINIIKLITDKLPDTYQ